MRSKLLQNFYKSSLVLILALLYSCSWTNIDYSVEGRTWDVCVKTDFANPNNECNYLVTYVFDKDGTFYEYSKSSSDSIQKIQSSRKFLWKLEDNLLTFDVNLGSLERVNQYKIKWINKSTFYTTEKNSMDITIETWYKARN